MDIKHIKTLTPETDHTWFIFWVTLLFVYI